jgi:hypothetical protein
MHELIVVCSNSSNPLSSTVGNLQELTMGAVNDMDESQRHRVRQKKLDKNNDSINMKFHNKQK